MNPHTKVVSQPLNCTFEQAWPQLWRKTYETKDYIQGLQELIIHEKTDNFVLRTMVMGPFTIKEKITQDKEKGIIYFENIEGSSLKGIIYNRLFEDEQKKLRIEFGTEATNSEGAQFPTKEMFQKGVDKTKEVIEKNI